MSNATPLPDWLKSWLADAQMMARWHGAMRGMYDKYRHQHVEWRQRWGMRAAGGDMDGIEEAAEIDAAVTARSEMRMDLWDARSTFHRVGEKRAMQLPLLLPFLAEDSRQKLADLRLFAPDWEILDYQRDDVLIVEQVLRFLQRLKGEAKHRRGVRMFLSMNESGMCFSVLNTAAGEADTEMLSDLRAGLTKGERES